MKVTLQRREMEVQTEDKTDEAYLEDTMGLKKPGDRVFLVRTDEKSIVGFLEDPSNTTIFLRTEKAERIKDE